MSGMNLLCRSFVWIGLLAFISCSGKTRSDISAVNLRVEYKTNGYTDAEAPRFSWELESKVNNQVQTAWQILVATSENLLTESGSDVWNSGKVSSDATNQVVFDGTALQSDATYYWKVRSWDAAGKPGPWSKPAYWGTGLKPSDWKAGWIGYDVNHLSTSRDYHLPPASCLRKETTLEGKIKKATLYVTALGLYEFYINGNRIGEDYFAPGWTDYDKRVYYNAYDVTREFNPGTNALAAAVATGWYAGYLGYAVLVGSPTTHSFYGKVPLLKAQLEIEYADGKKETLVTDDTWKASTGGIREADMLNGETYNANLEPLNWKNSGFDDSNWEAVSVAADKNSLPLQLYPGEPVRIIKELEPVSINEMEGGKYIIDLGQNFSGVVRVKLKGNKGDSAVIRYGEMLHPDSRLVTENLRRARATDTYIFKGDEDGETWMPRFTYHGFQFAEISGIGYKPSPADIRGIVMTSATPGAGNFTTDNAMLNQLYRNIVWTQLSNYFDIPTDCPQRDERLGWTGDAQVYMRSAAFNNDIAAFHTKWITDLNDAQWENGAYPVYAPIPSENGVATIRSSDTYSPGWAEAGIVCPYNIYKMYGDARIIETAWPYMAKYMQFLEIKSKGTYLFREASFEEISPKGGFGDWLSVGKKTPPDMLATMYYNYCALLMAEMANAIDKPSEAIRYNDISAKIKKAFAEHYLDADGRLTTNAAAYGNGSGYVDGHLGFSGHTQTAYANAIYLKVLPEENIAKAGQYLKELVNSNNNQLATGFLGFKPLLPALSSTGNTDLAYTLLKDTAYPSLGFEVVNGATTIWERWDSYIKGEGFRHNASMNSFNHYAFGAVCEWMFQHMAGIEPLTAGFKTFRIKPEIDKSGIGYVSATYHSINGAIGSSWKKEDGLLTQSVLIPVNTTAEVWVPGDVANITLNDKQLLQENVQVEKTESGYTKLQLGSGKYIIKIVQ